MYRNFMVKEVKSERGLKRIMTILRKNRIHYFLNEDRSAIRVNVGSARRSTKRFDICKQLGFKLEGAWELKIS